jgi:hypothetical protein
MPSEILYNVFLSHNAKDKAVVRLLRTCPTVASRRRRKEGRKIWPVRPKHLCVGGFDEWVLKPGDSIPAKIDPSPLRSYDGTGEGLEHSRVLACPAVVPGRRGMLCMSANAFGSDWTQSETRELEEFRSFDIQLKKAKSRLNIGRF